MLFQEAPVYDCRFAKLSCFSQAICEEASQTLSLAVCRQQRLYLLYRSLISAVRDEKSDIVSAAFGIIGIVAQIGRLRVGGGF